MAKLDEYPRRGKNLHLRLHKQKRLHNIRGWMKGMVDISHYTRYSYRFPYSFFIDH